MPTGIDAFRKKQAAKESQKAQMGFDGPRADYFELKAGQSAVVRFLEQGDELTFADVHRIPVADRRYPVDFICLDTNDDGNPCPACQHENNDIRKRSTKGFINLIWREGPVYKRNEYGKPEKDANGKKIVTGYADGVFLWNCSYTVFQMLIERDASYKGLMSRDFRIKRIGAGLQDTRYEVEPAVIDGGPQPMLLPDLALEKNKFDLRALTAPNRERLMTVISGGALPGGPQPTMDRSGSGGQQPVTAENVFAGGPAHRSSAFARD